MPIFYDSEMRRYRVQRDLREPVMINSYRATPENESTGIFLPTRGKFETKMVSESESRLCIYDLKKKGKHHET